MIRSPANRPRPGVALLVPIVTVLNVAFMAVDAVIGAAGWLLWAGATSLGRVHVPLMDVLAAMASAIRARAAANIALETTLVTSAVASAAGRPAAVCANQFLSLTLLAGVVRTLAWPAYALWDAGEVLVMTPPTRGWIAGLGLFFSRWLTPFSWPGVIPGHVGQLAAARTRLGLIVMSVNGSYAVMRNFQGMCGGALALLIGDPVWFAEGLERHRTYAHYVWEKEVNDELGPGSNFPMSKKLVAISDPIVNRFPYEFVRIMREDGWWAGLRAYGASMATVHRMFASYWTFTARMTWNVTTFLSKGLLDAPDAQRVVLCEMAISTSSLPPDEKEAALFEVRKTAPNTISTFEHYVPLLVPYDGTVDDKVYRRTCGNEIFDTRTVVPSIFDKTSIRFAQSTNAEAFSLRTFLWLFRDEAWAQAVNNRETVRKFGPETAARIASAPLYPVAPDELEALTADGPRPGTEVAAILDAELRARGLAAIADAIARPASASLLDDLDGDRRQREGDVYDVLAVDATPQGPTLQQG